MAENTLDKYSWIIESMPYGQGFLFVDEISSIDEDSIEAYFTFAKDLSFFNDHFIENPITPGVILTECMAQIGLVAFGIYNYVNTNSHSDKPKIGLSSTDMHFYIPVLPDEKVKVIAEKQYFRFNKLKCLCRMYNSKDQLVCKGEISGMIDNK